MIDFGLNFKAKIQMQRRMQVVELAITDDINTSQNGDGREWGCGS